MVVFQFLCERMEVAKYSSREQVEVFVSMLQKSLTINVGKPHNIMSRHVTAVGTRFRYTTNCQQQPHCHVSHTVPSMCVLQIMLCDNSVL